MPLISRQFGPLFGHISHQLPEGTAPVLGVVLCHGYGAPGTDLTQLAPALMQLHPELLGKVQFFFPEAPLSLAELGMLGGRAWWQFSVQKFLAQLQSGTMEEVRKANPEGLSEACALLMDSVSSWKQQAGLQWNQIVLGGFSQGAMLSLQAAATLAEPTAGVVVLSGTLINEPFWRRGLAEKPDVPIYQSHGRRDQVLPYLGAEWLHEMINELELPHTFHPFTGDHEISWDVLESLGEFLKNLVPKEHS